MKLSLVLLLVFLLGSCAVQRSINPTPLYFDENKEAISEEEFYLRWRDRENPYSRWDSIHDGIRYISLSSTDYEQYLVSPTPFLENIQKLTGKKFSENTILLLEFEYKDDLCSSNSSNSWNARKIKERKRWIGPKIEKIKEEYKDLVYLTFFEDGIELSNLPASEEEYFFKDEKGFLRKTVFRNPTLCGSFALIRPNGQMLVLNGESTVPYVAAHLKPGNWAVFFPEEE